MLLITLLTFAATVYAGPAPKVETEVHGKSKVQHHYDKSGNLTEVVFYDYSVEPAQVERLMIEKDVRVRTTQRGRLTIRRETERYSAPGVLREREIEWCSEGNGDLDRKTVMTYDKFKIDVLEYKLQAGEWTMISTKAATGLAR